MVNLQDYIIESGLFKTLKVDDLLFVEYKCLIDDPVSEIWAHSNYIAYVLGGEKRWKTPASEVKVGAGEALFVKKGANAVYQYFDEPFFVIFIFIPDDFIRRIIAQNPEWNLAEIKPDTQGHSLEQLDLNPVLDSYFQSLLSLFSQGAIHSKSVLRLKLEELILHLLTQPGNPLLKRYFFSLGRQQKVDITELMNANYFRPLTIHDYARLCARSLSSFRRDFKDIYGETPGKWLLRKRLKYSQFLLKTTDLPIYDVMDQSGFKDRSHFTKSFKQMFGLSPNKYRSMKSLEVV